MVIYGWLDVIVNVNIPGEIGGIIYKLIVSYIYSSDVYVVIVFRLIGKIVEIGLVNPPDIVNYNYYPNVVHGQPMRLNLIVKYDEVFVIGINHGCMVCAGTKNILSKQYFFYASN